MSVNVNMTFEQVTSLLSKSPRKNGRFNLFFKINDNLGLKLSKSKEDRDGNYERQTAAAKHGLGPETYGIIDCIEFNGTKYYGYFTEIVEVFPYSYEVSYILTPEEYEDYDTLYDNLRKKIGFCFTDSHSLNIGRKTGIPGYPNGKIVCIDFDSNSFFEKISLGCERNEEYVIPE